MDAQDNERESRRIVGLMGSYRRGGVVDTTVEAILQRARAAGFAVEKIDLIDRDIRFCGNCRACCQEPGAERGACVIDDDVDAILRRLENADAIVLGAPVNFGDVNARMRQFLERMLGYAYWPPEARGGPKLRNAGGRRKPAVLVTSSAAPSLLTRMFARPLKTLRTMARLLGARPVDSVVVGLVGASPYAPDRRAVRAVERAARRLSAAVG